MEFDLLLLGAIALIVLLILAYEPIVSGYTRWRGARAFKIREETDLRRGRWKS